MVWFDCTVLQHCNMEFTLTERGSRMVIKDGYRMFFKKHWPMISSVTNVLLEERDCAKQKESSQRMIFF